MLAAKLTFVANGLALYVDNGTSWWHMLVLAWHQQSPPGAEQGAEHLVCWQ